jgi:hypothetical protein
MSVRLHAAVRDNAEWCDLVCRTHGLVAFGGERVWSCPVRTPALYPDAITLRPGVRADEVLADIDTAPGCSVKDSYADVELGSLGFRVLVNATWLWHTRTHGGARPAPQGWSIITGAVEFGEWERAWRADGPGGVLLPALVDAPNVDVLARLVDGEIVAGCVVHHTDTAIGLSNVFALALASQTYAELVEVLGSRWPERPVVGYEHGPKLQLATDVGFEPIGDLRIWVRDP